MKCALLGTIGVVVVLAIAAVLYPQYSDYRAAAETSSWLAQLEETKRSIVANFERKRSLAGAGVGISRLDFSTPSPSYFNVTNDGTIFVQGGSEGQLVVLVPSASAGKVSWACIGGSKKAALGCRNVP